MTKLEEKLEELGYSVIKYFYDVIDNIDDIDDIASEGYAERDIITLVLNEDSTKVVKGVIECYQPISTQEELNDIQSSYDNMQKDLNTLRELGYYDTK